MKKLVSLALALVLILGVTVIPVSASSDIDHPAGWEGFTSEDFKYRDCRCDEANVPHITLSDFHFSDLGLELKRAFIDENIHIVGLKVRDKASGDFITIDLRTDEGKALYAEYEAKWLAMKNGETDKTATTPAPTATPTPVPTATPTPVSASAASSDFTIENGVLTKYNGPGGNVFIPNNVTSIGRNAFAACQTLTSVTIPNSVTRIGEYAFAGCQNLTNVTIPNSVTYIGEYAFSCCYSLTTLTLSDNVTTIKDWTFNSCTSLTSVTIPNGVTSIGGSAFWNCKLLTNVTIPDSVTRIGKYAFSSCGSLTTIYGAEGSFAQRWAMDEGHTFKATLPSTAKNPVATPTPTPTPSAKQVDPNFDETVFTDLGLVISLVSHDGLDKNGIDTYVIHTPNYIFGQEGSFSEYVTNALGDETYAKYKALRDTVIRKMGSPEASKGEVKPSTEKPSTPPTEPPVVTTPPPIEPPATPTAFPDVTSDAWYAEAVNAMTAAGIIKGDGNGNFRPNDAVTYGEFVTILARIADTATEYPDNEKRCSCSYNCYGRRTVSYRNGNMPHWAAWANYQLETAIWNDTQMIVNPEDLNCNVVRGHALSLIYRTMGYVGLDTTPVNDYTEADIPDWNETVGVDNGWGHNVYYIDDQLHFLPGEFIHTEFWRDDGIVTTGPTGYNMNDVKYSNPAMKPYVPANPYDVLAAYNIGITEGVDAAHTCNPLGTLTRAELCVMLYRAGLDHVFTK